MTDSGPFPRYRRSIVSLAIAAAGLALLVISVRQAGWDTIVNSFRSLGPWILVVVLLGAARMAVRARAWTLCSRAQHDTGIPFRAALVAILAGDALGNLTPLGLLASEPAKVVMGRRHVSTAASVSSVAVENGFYTASVAAMLLGGVWVMLQRADVPPVLERMGEGSVVAALVGGLVALWVFRTRPAVLSRLAPLVGRLLRRPASPDALTALEQSIYDVVHWPTARLAHVAAWEVLFHAAAVAEVWLILRMIPGGEGTTLIEAFLMETTGRFITVAFKFIPYRLGIDEMGSGSVSQLLGLGTPAGVTLALVRRVRILLLNAAGVALLARDQATLEP